MEPKEQAKNNKEEQETQSFLSSSENSTLLLPPAPDGGFGWVVVAASFVISVICDGCSFSFGVLFTELLDAFGESKGKTSLVGSLFLGISLLLGPFASALTTKYGCRFVTIVGGLIASLGFIASSFATSIEALCFTYGVISGTGMSLCLVTSMVIVAYYFEKKRALATGLSLCGTGIGTAIFAPLAEYLIEQFGWRGFLLIFGGIVLNIVICGALFRPLKFTREQKRKQALHSFEKMSETLSHQSFELRGRSRMNSKNEDSKSTSDTGEDENVELEQISHSQAQLPTFVNSKLKEEITPEVVTQVRRNGSTIEYIIQKYLHTMNLNMISDFNSSSDQLALTNDDDIIMIKTNTNGSFEDGSQESGYQARIADIANKLVINKQLLITTPTHLEEYVPMYRKDIFYRGNLKKLCNSQMQYTSCPELYIRSAEENVDWPNFLCITRDAKQFVKSMFDLKIMKHPLFLLFSISNFVLYFWADVPFVFISDRAIELGFSEVNASIILSVMGVLNTIGQIWFGFLGDRNVNLSIMYAISIIASGVMVFCLPFSSAYWYMTVFGAGFAFFISSNYTLLSIMVVHYVGIDKLTNGIGLLMMIQGISNLAGPPLAGWMSDNFNSYNATFFTSGVFIVVSGLMMFLAPILNRNSSQRVALFAHHEDSSNSKMSNAKQHDLA